MSKHADNDTNGIRTFRRRSAMKWSPQLERGKWRRQKLRVTLNSDSRSRPRAEIDNDHEMPWGNPRPPFAKKTRVARRTELLYDGLRSLWIYMRLTPQFFTRDIRRCLLLTRSSEWVHCLYLNKNAPREGCVCHSKKLLSIRWCSIANEKSLRQHCGNSETR